MIEYHRQRPAFAPGFCFLARCALSTALSCPLVRLQFQNQRLARKKLNAPVQPGALGRLGVANTVTVITVPALRAI
jgi:hypothetical protein